MYIINCRIKIIHFYQKEKKRKKMSFNCSYSFCTAAVHNLEGCRNAVSKYFSKEYKGIHYFICPTCSSYSTESFDTFMSEHGHHLIGFKDAKISVLLEGKIFFSIFYFYFLFSFKRCSNENPNRSSDLNIGGKR